jgi:hypothetical protein
MVAAPTPGTVVRMLRGSSALTAFEAVRLLARLRQIDPGVTAVAAHFLYLLQLPEDALIDDGRLHELLALDAITNAPSGGSTPDPGPSLYIGPRVGTQSPWSSKATDILHNTGFAAIPRIERARAVAIAGAQSLEVLAPALHDRMTESVFAKEDSLSTLFAPREPGRSNTSTFSPAARRLLRTPTAPWVSRSHRTRSPTSWPSSPGLAGTPPTSNSTCSPRPTASIAGTRYSTRAGPWTEQGSRARSSA